MEFVVLLSFSLATLGSGSLACVCMSVFHLYVCVFQIDLKKMPLGKLSKKQIESAYKVLKELQNVSATTYVCVSVHLPWHVQLKNFESSLITYENCLLR